VFGPPAADGSVEFAFGLVPAVRGQGLAIHAVIAAVELVQSTGAASARAECEIANLPARRVLENAGLVEVGRNDDVLLYEIRF
jgi:RimJ/RimL family protein N-acetyltransferase